MKRAERHISMRLMVKVAAGLALAVIAGCGGSGTVGGPGRAASAAAVHRLPTVAASPLKGNGELAFIARGKLFLSGGPTKGSRHVPLPGIPYAPAWSANDRWLAVEVSSPPPPGQPYLYGTLPARIWLVNAAGTAARPLTPKSWQVSGFAWAPHEGVLAVAAYLPRATQDRSDLAATVALTGRTRVLVRGGYVTGPAWSPDGRRIAVGLGAFTGGRWRSELDVVSAAGGSPTVVTATTGNVLDLAGWWPDGNGLLYWFDFQGSGSIAADGLPLDRVALAAPRPRTLVKTMLVHWPWLAFSPRGSSLAAVSGGDRVIWSGRKHITLCGPGGTCTSVAQPAGVVSADPSWSPGGTAVAFARLSASGPFGPDGHADFSRYWITRWEATSEIWIVSADGSGARPLAAAGRGAVDPVWGSGGSLLFVRHDSLWLLPASAATATRLTSALGALSGGPYYLSYYGYVPYPQFFAWTLARPQGQ